MGFYIPFSPINPCCLFPFFVDLPTLQIESMFFLENPTSLLKTNKVDGATVLVMSLVVSTNSSVGCTPSGY